MPFGGEWVGRLSQVGQSDWFSFPVRANRTFTIVTQATDETGTPSDNKAMPVLGIWDAFDAIGTTAVGTAPALNGLAPGETFLRVSTLGADIVRIGIADQRGDGRPNYSYNGWVLYADTVSPQRLPASGGPIVIHGMGFRLADTVLVGGQPALVTSISPNEITALAPAAANGVTGSVDVEVDDLPFSTPPPFSLAASATTPAQATRSPSTPLLQAPSPSPRPFPSPSPRSAPTSHPPAVSASFTPSPRAPRLSPAACPSARSLPPATAAPP